MTHKSTKNLPFQNVDFFKYFLIHLFGGTGKNTHIEKVLDYVVNKVQNKEVEKEKEQPLVKKLERSI